MTGGLHSLHCLNLLYPSAVVQSTALLYSNWLLVCIHLFRIDLVPISNSSYLFRYALEIWSPTGFGCQNETHVSHELVHSFMKIFPDLELLLVWCEASVSIFIHSLLKILDDGYGTFCSLLREFIY